MFYTWKKKYAHVDVSELRRLRQLEEENGRLKQLVADLSLDKHMLSEALRKKSIKPARRRELTQWFRETFQVSCKWACRLAQFSRAAWYRPAVGRGINRPHACGLVISTMQGRGLGISGSGYCGVGKDVE